MTRSRHLPAALVALVAPFALAVALSASACEALVGATPSGSIQCVDGPNVCPEGQQCVNGSCANCATPGCIPPVILDAGHAETAPPMDAHADVIVHDAAVDVHVVDVGHDVAPEVSLPRALGAQCDTNAQCASLLCATMSDLPGVTVGSGLCSTPCCDDTICGDNLSCYATSGGNLCVPTNLESCNGSCPVPCCGTSGCGSGTSSSCGLPLDGGAAIPSCQPFGGDFSDCLGGGDGAGGDGCEFGSDCRSGLCIDDGLGGGCGVCTQPCCSDSGCSGGQSCIWDEVTTVDEAPAAFIHFCTASSGAATGEACTRDGDCIGNVCASDICTAPCCTDVDCPSMWSCLPYEQTLTVGTLAILVCQRHVR